MKWIITMINCVNGSFIWYNCMNNKQGKKMCERLNKKIVLFYFGKSCDCTSSCELNQMCVCDIFRSGAAWDEPRVQTLSLHHPAEGEAAEGNGGAAGHRRGFSLPFPPQSSSQTPTPALQTVWLRLHRWVWPRVTQLTHHSSVSVKEVFQLLLHSATCVEVFPNPRGRMEKFTSCDCNYEVFWQCQVNSGG